MILCCDTSTDFAVFALAGANGDLLAELTLLHGRELSRRFFGALDSLFSAAGASLDRVDAFAAGIGPGSFTGVRVAVATLKTLSQATGKPLVGVGTLDIFAGLLVGSLPADSRIAAVLPSRRGEVYAALYSAEGKLREPAFVATYDRLGALLGDLALKHPLALCGAVWALEKPPECSLTVEAAAPPAASFARLAASALKAHPHGNLADVAPLYVAPPAISQHKNR